MANHILRRSISKAITIEIVFIIISYFVVQILGGHIGMLVAMALHLPTSILAIIASNYNSSGITSDSGFYFLSTFVIILHVIFMAAIFHYFIKNGKKRSALSNK